MNANVTTLTSLCRYICLVCILASPFLHATDSHVLSESELASLKLQVAKTAPEFDSFNALAKIEHYLTQVNQREAMLIKHIWLKRMQDIANAIPSESSLKRRWVTSQIHNTETLQVRDAGHRHVNLTVIDIGASATALVQLWRYQARAHAFAAQFAAGQIVWPERFGEEDEQGFVLWLHTLNNEDARYVAHAFYQHYQGRNPATDNRILYHLARRAADADMWQWLISQPVDQYSYSAIARVKQYLDEEQALKLISKVLNGNDAGGDSAQAPSKLASTALMTLARDYSHAHDAQAMFKQAAAKSKYSWLAAAATANIQDQNFRDELAVFYSKSNAKSANFALKALRTSITRETY